MSRATKVLTKKEIQGIWRSLRRWYGKNGRDLPWRTTRDPYSIWVSEIMLQQTRVETVVPYFQKFLANFPTVPALANAPLDKVLKAWEGLGYYARARHLHEGARLVCKKWKGLLPDTYEELIRIPGVGRSTAGAILSLAFQKPAPILDGNVQRVLCRLFVIPSDPRKPAVQKKLWSLSQSLTPCRDPYTYQQAIMDLGATLCTPRNPNCLACPFRSICLAFRQGLERELPVKTRKKPIPRRQQALGIIRNRGRVLIYRRPLNGLLAGLWGFPSYPRESGQELAKTLAQGLLNDYGLTIDMGGKLGTISHTYSHFAITLHVFEANWLRNQERAGRNPCLKWVFPSRLADYALSGADRKAIPLIPSGQ